MNPFQRDEAIATLKRSIVILQGLPVETRCIECMSFARKSGGYCNKWKTIVPETAQELGCAKWDNGIIPF